MDESKPMIYAPDGVDQSDSEQCSGNINYPDDSVNEIKQEPETEDSYSQDLSVVTATDHADKPIQGEIDNTLCHDNIDITGYACGIVNRTCTKDHDIDHYGRSSQDNQSLQPLTDDSKVNPKLECGSDGELSQNDDDGDSDADANMMVRVFDQITDCTVWSSTRDRDTLPRSLDISQSMVASSGGVFSQGSVPSGVTYGPYEGIISSKLEPDR
jgi:hypothetical protein